MINLADSFLGREAENYSLCGSSNGDAPGLKGVSVPMSDGQGITARESTIRMQNLSERKTPCCAWRLVLRIKIGFE